MQGNTVTVVGTTTWGTTLALMLARRGIEVMVLARTEQEAQSLDAAREHLARLPGHEFPSIMHVSADWQAGLAFASAVLFVVPSHTLRDNARRAAPHITGDPLIVSGCKGLEKTTFKRMSTVLSEELPGEAGRHCVLSGPNLAREIVQGWPASTVVSSANPAAAQEVQVLLNSSTFRVYTNSDVIGTEIAGALKNVIAIGSGICDGMGLGDNAKAGFLTRGLAEMTRLGVAAGAQPVTFAGNAGLGDLVTTCYSNLSRNHRVGMSLAQGLSLEEAIEALNGEIAEGVFTTQAALDMANELDVEMPITELTSRVLFDGASPMNAVSELMARAPRRE